MTLVVNLQTTVPAWMEDLHADVDAKTGYLVPHPRGPYGQKVKELVRYFSGQSVELKAIRHGRRMRPNACCLYTGMLFQFLSEYVFPIAFAVSASYMYYQWTPTEAPPTPLETPVPSNIHNDTAVESGWFGWMPSAAEAGNWLGSTTRSFASVPVTFLAHAVDRSLHVQEAFASIQSTGSKIFLLPLLFVAVYFLTKIVCRVLLHIQTLCSAQRRIWHLQEILIQDTEEALERGITGLVRPFLLNYYETILSLPSSSNQLVPADKAKLLSLTQTYRGHLPLLRVNLYDRLATEVKQIPFAEVVKRGGLSPSYQRALHQLIRYADDELSNVLFSFHEEIHRVPDAIQSKVLDAGQFAIQGAKRVASTAMLLASA